MSKIILLLVLSVLLLLAVSTANAQADRAADREAIRAHIDSIFQAFIKKDNAALSLRKAVEN